LGLESCRGTFTTHEWLWCAVTGGGGHHKNWNRGKLVAALVGWWWWWQLRQESIPLYQRQNSHRIPNFIAVNIPILGLSW